ncbi:thiamine phosphate synthase [Pistricoccus aurantiacus]|uniref:Thiamine-phosphate synthase n=1 Tax=Pistricoccus aurantiacus TaxID=1883414 RepID=A0A5B8SSU7_9GAMM|nr:thiamine phosphate synthase [Pistricoccus aurantiacus]QEA38163.1 thiamine phosphate synthase [Pistricoccus aurantiacus]
MKFDLSLYLITDPALCAEKGLVETVKAAVEGGVSMVQLRDKHASDADMIEEAKALKEALAGSGVPLIINDRLDVALAAGADGLHMGQSDGDVAAARRALGPNAILGLSVSNHAQMREVNEEPLDYLGLGPIFATQTKDDHDIPLGFDGLEELAAASSLPCVAIGGLKADHVEAVRKAGAQGLAVVSAICATKDPKAAAQEFKRSTD